MSARKNVNQSRPRALARAAASCTTGAVCFAAADDAKPASARRPSRPPSNSSASADSPMSPAPSGKYGVGFGRVPRAIGPPHLLRRPIPAKPDTGRRSRAYDLFRVRKGGKFEKPACEFLANRYDEKASPPRTNGETELLHRGTVGRPWRSTRFILQFTSSHIQTSRSVHSKRRPKSFGAMPAISSIAKPSTYCTRSKVPPRWNRRRPPERPFAPGQKRKACCWSRRKIGSAPRFACPARKRPHFNRAVSYKTYLRLRIAAIALTSLRA